VRDGAEGPPIRSAGAVAPGQALSLQFADGCVAATAQGGGIAPAGGAADPPQKAPRSRPERASKAASKSTENQGSLF
jgi:exodeoxyribonuclease VII large subunit